MLYGDVWERPRLSKRGRNLATAFYAGWPSAVTAIVVAREVFEKK